MSARSLLARLGLALGLAGAMQGETTAARSMPLEKAPAAWVAYAKHATTSIAAWLNAEASPAPRMRQAMTKLRPQTDQQLPPLGLAIWVAPTGAISKIEAKSSGNAQADADLRSVLLGRKLGIPPKDMLQPMRLAVQLSEAKPDEAKAEGYK